MTTLQTTFKTLAEFKAVYTGHFFDKKTMKFFRSRIESGLIKGVYFITSESDMRDTERFYNVRSIGQLESGEYTVNSIYEFNKIKSKERAKEIIRQHSMNLI